MNTGDLVEEKGDFLRIIGRVSDVINVGGQKVFPVEVESVLQEHTAVAEATVHAVPHPVLGQVVGVKLTLNVADCEREALLQDIKAHCRERLQKYKIPMRWKVIGINEHGNERGKKVRR
jgi:long-chain acyl-CoA synthetase